MAALLPTPRGLRLAADLNCPAAFALGRRAVCLTPQAASAQALWQRADAQIQAILQGTSLQMLLNDELLAGTRARAAKPVPRSPVLPSVDDAAGQARPSRGLASIFDLAGALA